MRRVPCSSPKHHQQFHEGPGQFFIRTEIIFHYDQGDAKFSLITSRDKVVLKDDK